MCQPPALENDGAVLNFINDGDRYSPRSDQDLRETLRIIPYFISLYTNA
jgi:hypothetical protein